MRLIDADVMHREIDKFDLEGRMSLKNIKRYIDAQPTAYDINKTIEQSKADGCNGCKYISKDEYEEPCLRCKRNCKDYWRPRGHE